MTSVLGLPRRNLFNILGRPAVPAIFPISPRIAPERWGLSRGIRVTSEDDRTQYSVRLPGAKPEDIDVTASSGVLTISGRRERQRQSRRGGYRWQERSVSTFSRSVALPEQADAEKAYGVIDRDVLRITVPHRQPSPPVNIKIDDAGNGD